MFGLYFGNYLVEKNKMTRSQLDEILHLQRQSRAKLGLIAVSEKLLTVKQAEEINDIQRKMDCRFGDIAIEKGYLLAEEVTYLLNMQGNSYLQFVQTITEHNILTVQELETYLNEYKKAYNFTDSDIDALKSGDIDRIIPVFIDMDTPFYGEFISLFIRNIIRFINTDLIITKAHKVHDYSFGALASQRMAGTHDFFAGLACQNKELLEIANPFAGEAFTDLNEDSFDSVCEFINCANGLYASKLSLKDIQIDMIPPLFDSGKKLTSTGDIYVVGLIINGKQSDLLITVDQHVDII